MASLYDSTSNLSLREIKSDIDVQSFLLQRDALHSWDDFKEKFFRPVKKHIEQSEQFLITEEEFVRLGDLLFYFKEFITSDRFQQYVNEWRNYPESIEWPSLREKIRLEFQIERYLVSKDEGREYDISHQHALKGELEKLQTILMNLFADEEVERSPEEEQVREALEKIFGQITDVTDKIEEVLTRSAPDFELEKETAETLKERMLELDESSRREILRQIAELEEKQRELIKERLKKHRTDIYDNKEEETSEQVEKIEQSKHLVNAPSKSGLVLGSLEFLRDKQEKEYKTLIVEFILHMVVVISVRGLVEDTIETVRLLVEALEELLEYLEKRFENIIEETNKKYDEGVQKILGLRTEAIEESLPDGGGNEEDSPAPLEPIDLVGLVAVWSAVAKAWQESLQFLGNFEEKVWREIEEILSRNNLRRETLETPDTHWESVFNDWDDDKRSRSARDAQRLLTLLDSLERKLEQEQEKQERTDGSGTPLVTPTDAFDGSQEEGAEEKKFREIGKIARDKATLDTIVESRLREVLSENGLPKAEVERQIELFRSGMASELWLQLLQEGILTEKLSFERIIEIQTEFVAKYSAIILKRTEGINPQLIQQRLQEFYNANPTIDKSALESQFQPEKIREILEYARELNTPQKRWNAVLSFCQKELGYVPEKEYFDFFLQLTDGGSVLESSLALDGLTQNLYQRTWLELTEKQQNEVLEKIAAFNRSFGAAAALFGLREMILLQGQINQLVANTKLRQAYIDQLRALGQERSAQLLVSLAGYGETEETEPGAAPEPSGSAATQAIEISTTLFIIQTLEISPDQRQILEALAIERQLRNEAFGPAELGYLMAALQGEGAPGFVDPAMQASLDPQLQRWRELQQADEAAFRQQRAALHEQSAQQSAGSSVNAQRQKLMMAMKLAKAAAGGPAAWAMLLKDPQVRAMITRFMSDPKKFGPVLGLILAPPVAVGALLGSALRDPIGTIGSLLSPGGTTVASVGIPAGLSEGLAEGGTAVQAGVGKELGSTLAKATQGATNLARTVPATISNGVSSLGLGKTFAVLAGVSLLGPLGMAGIVTIIVITVIGGSLNDFPLGVVPNGPIGGRQGRLARFNGNVCWPTNGHLGQLDTDYHNKGGTWMGKGTALDISGRIGTPIYTPYAGTVSAAGQYDPSSLASDYGYWVKLEADIGVSLIFGHMAEMPQVEAGKRVEAGDPLGIMGNTGRSSGPHLHYEVYDPTGRITIRDVIPSEPVVPEPGTPGHIFDDVLIRIDMCGTSPTDQPAGDEADSEEDADSGDDPKTILPADKQPADDQPSPQDLLDGNFTVPQTQ